MNPGAIAHSGAAAASCRILNGEPGRLSPRARAQLHELGEVSEVETDRAYLLEHIARFDVMFIGLRNTIDAELLQRATHLGCIVTPTTGIDHVDLEAARAHGIDVLSLRGEADFLRDITATAELAWGLLLALVRKIPAAHRSVLGGLWNRDDFYGEELKGKTLGVVGCGRLGSMVAAYALAFRMQVLAWDRKAPALEGVQLVDLPDLLARSDVVSIHLPLSEDTRGLFDAQKLASMRSSAVLINTARGEIVDEGALLAALRSGKLAGAAVDVLATETSLDPRWLEHSAMVEYARIHPNLLLTPHIGGVTHHSVEATNLFMIAKLKSWIAANASKRGSRAV